MGHSIGSTLRAQSPMAQSRSRSRSKSPEGLRIQTKVPNSHRGLASTGRSMSAGPRRKSVSDFGSKSVNSVSESDRFDLSQISTAGPGPPAYKLRKPPGADSPAWTFGAQSRQQLQLEQKRIGLGAGVQTKSRTPPKRRKSAGDRLSASEQPKWPTSPTLDLKRNDLLIREVGDEHTGAESHAYRIHRLFFDCFLCAFCVCLFSALCFCVYMAVLLCLYASARVCVPLLVCIWVCVSVPRELSSGLGARQAHGCHQRM